MKSLRLGVIFSLLYYCPIFCSIEIHAQNVYYVYSVQGKVTLDSKGKQKSLKIFDRMTDNDVFSVSVNSRFSFVSVSDKRYYETTKQGRFMVKSIVKDESNTVSANSNTIKYVIDNFVQKGGLINGEGPFSESGVVERGVDVKLLDYPFNKTLVYMSREFKPVFNDSLGSIRDEFSVSFLQEGIKYPVIKVKRGDSVKIPVDAVDYAPLILLCKWGNESQFIKLNIADEDKMKELAEGMEYLKSSFFGQSEVELILAQALYLESMGCYLDVIRLYETLENQQPEYRDTGLVKHFLSSH